MNTLPLMNASSVELPDSDSVLNNARIRPNPSSVSARSDEPGISQMFVDLLVAQVTNQNPLSPMDGTAYASQLAEFSNVENLTSLNQQMAQQIAMTENTQTLQAMALLGQNATIGQSSLSLPEPSRVQGMVDVPNGADRIEVRLKRADGRVMASDSLSVDEAATIAFAFEEQPAGQYTVDAEAVMGSHRQVTSVQMQGSIEQIRLGDNPGDIDVLMNGVGWVNVLALNSLRASM